MELQYWPPLPILFTFFFLFLFILRRKGATHVPPRKLPPGPTALPIIGSIHHMITSLPHRTLRDLAGEHGPLMHLKLGQVSTIVVSSPQMAREVLKTHDLAFAYRPELLISKVLFCGHNDIVFAPYGDYWRQLRKICVLELLSAKRVQSFRRVREEEVGSLIQSLRTAAGAGWQVNLTKKFYALSCIITSRAAFGKRCSHHERFIAMVREIGKLSAGFNITDVFPSLEFVNVISRVKFRMEKVHRELDRMLELIIQEHKSKVTETSTEDVGGEDLVDVLLRLQEEGDLEFPLTTHNIKAVIFDMFVGGTETSATSMVWTMAELMRNPSVMQKVQAEVREVIHMKGKASVDENSLRDMRYLRMVINESLRLHPPLPLLIPRECSQRCEIGGYEIPTKARVMVNAWAIGRDPTHWKNAEDFNPGRFDGSLVDFKGGSMEYIPFGAGRRICPGMQFGFASMEIALAQLLYFFNWEIPGGIKPEDFDMAEAVGMSVGRKADLCLFTTPYAPLVSEM